MTEIKGQSGTFRAVLDNLRRFAWPLFLTSVFYRIIAIILLTPLASRVTSMLISGSGRVIVVNEEIAAFFLKPFGLFTLIITAAVSLTLIALEQACLMTIAFETGLSGYYRALNALKFVFPRALVILGLAARIVLRVLLLGIPFLALVGLLYILLLSGHDINYYLALRPPVFRWALAITGLIGLGFAIALTGLAARMVLSLPIILFESKPAPSALRESGLRTRGHRRRFALSVFIWIVGVSAATGLNTSLFVWLGHLLVPVFVGHTKLLLLVFGGLFMSFSLSQVLLSMAATSSFSLLMVGWYRELTPITPQLDFKPATGKNAEKLLNVHISGRIFIAGTLLALVLAIATGWLLLSRVELKDRTEIMAHRGASAAAPENTLAAIEKAITDGAHWVEIDVQRTADDHVVVVHDRDLMKIGGSPLVVSESSLKDIVEVDVGSWFDPAFSSQRVPTLDRVLEHCKEAIKVNIELKYYKWDERLVPRVIEIVEKSGMVNEIVIMSLQPKAVLQLKKLRPGWRAGLLSAAALTDLTRVQSDFLVVHSRMANRQFIRRVQNSKKSLYVWTVNDPVGMMQMFDLGVDVIITDKPALGAQLLAQRKDMDPIERLLMATGFLVVGEPEHVNPATDGF